MKTNLGDDDELVVDMAPLIDCVFSAADFLPGRHDPEKNRQRITTHPARFCCVHGCAAARWLQGCQH